MNMDIIDILCVVTAFLLFLLGIFLISSKKGEKISNRILTACLLFNAVFVLNYFLFRGGRLPVAENPQLYRSISYIGNSFYILLGPLIYLYTKSLCYSGFVFRIREYFHFVPFFLLSVPMVAYIQARYTAAMRAGEEGWIAVTPLSYSLFFGFLYLVLFLYIAITIWLLLRYRKELKLYYSNVRAINLSWLMLILVAFIVMVAMDVGAFLLSFFPFDASALKYILTSVSLFINFAFVSLLVFRGLNQPYIFTGLTTGHKYASSKLTREMASRYLEKLRLHLEKEKPFLDPSLSLNDLAENLSIPARHLSQVINESLNQNFFDMIGDYRIEEAKGMLMEYSSREKSVLEILYDVGFNTKSSFNSLFKKKTGMTPTEYRRAHSQP